MIFQLITDISFALLLLVSTQLFMASSINKVEFFSYIIIGLSLSNVLKAFSTQYTFIQYLKLATDKLINVHNEKEISYELEKVTLPNYDIKFQNVNFSYEKDTPILKNITFEAKQGTKICPSWLVRLWKNNCYQPYCKILGLPVWRNYHWWNKYPKNIS